MAGAAGGLAGGLWAFAGAQLRPGAALVLEAVGFDARAQQACMVVTGEGRLDDQTLHGKAVFEVATRARQAGVPCYVVPGEDALDPFGKRLLNIEAEGADRGPGDAGPATGGGGATARPPPGALPSQPARARRPRRSRRSSAPR